MLQAEDLGGTPPDPGGPDPAAHPLPPMPCPTSSARLAVEGLDVPRGSDYDARHCDGTWMVVEVNETAGACGPRDGGQRPGCTVTPRVRRWFLKHGTRGWTPLAATQDAGCGPVHAVEPAFPRHLCANLPAM